MITLSEYVNKRNIKGKVSRNDRPNETFKQTLQLRRLQKKVAIPLRYVKCNETFIILLGQGKHIQEVQYY